MTDKTIKYVNQRISKQFTVSALHLAAIFWPVHRNVGEKKLNFVLLFISGLKRTATIHSLSFSPCGHFLACSSNTETIHIFRLDDKPKDGRKTETETGSGGAQSGQSSVSDSWMGYIGNVVSSVPSYLPSQVTDTLLQERAFATVHHNLSGKKNICALAM